jgi:hypothetical protein
MGGTLTRGGFRKRSRPKRLRFQSLAFSVWDMPLDDLRRRVKRKEYRVIKVAKAKKFHDIWGKPITIPDEKGDGEHDAEMQEATKAFFNALHLTKAQDKSWKWTDGEHAAAVALAMRDSKNGYFEVDNDTHIWLIDSLKTHGHLVFRANITEVVKAFEAVPEKGTTKKEEVGE